jgi:hypothetical protein
LEEAFFDNKIDEYNPIKVGFKDGVGVKCRDSALERAAKSKCKEMNKVYYVVIDEAPLDKEDTENTIFVCGLNPRNTE